jgi:hypothetical protein
MPNSCSGKPGTIRKQNCGAGAFVLRGCVWPAVPQATEWQRIGNQDRSRVYRYAVEFRKRAALHLSDDFSEPFRHVECPRGYTPSTFTTQLNFDLTPVPAAQASAGQKKGKHMVWVPSNTGSHIGGRLILKIGGGVSTRGLRCRRE